VERNDRLFAHVIRRVRQQVHHLRQQAGHVVAAHQLADGGERGGDCAAGEGRRGAGRGDGRARTDERVAAPQVRLQRVDGEDEQVVAVVQEERDGEVANLLVGHARLARLLHRVDVRERRGLAQQLQVNRAQQVLLQPRLVQLRVRQPLLERLRLARHDPVLLHLRLALADRLDERRELEALARPSGALGSLCEVQAERAA
jgi:hypothetical protein